MIDINNKPVVLSCATTSASAIVPETVGVLSIYNAGSVPVFVRSGATSATAVTTDQPIPPTTTRIVSKPAGHQVVAGITASSTATLYINPGAHE